MALGPVASTNSKVASNFGACSPRFPRKGVEDDIYRPLWSDYGVRMLVEKGGDRERERERDRMSQREGSRRTRDRERLRERVSLGSVVYEPRPLRAS